MKRLLILLILFTSVGVQAFDLDLWMEDEAMRLYLLKEENDSRLHQGNRVTKEEIQSRIFYLKYYSKKFEYMCPKIPARRAWKDSFAQLGYESYFVNWRTLDGGKSFGWISMRWTTAEMVAKIYKFDWKHEKRIIGNSDKLQAKYYMAYYYWLANKFNGRRDMVLTAYNKGQDNVSYGRRTEEYYFKVLGRIAENERIWKEIKEED